MLDEEQVCSCGVCIWAQQLEEVKKAMADLDAHADQIASDTYDKHKQLLLMDLYRATGPAKVKAAVEHIKKLLMDGAPIHPSPATVHVEPGCDVACRGRLEQCREPCGCYQPGFFLIWLPCSAIA